MCLKQSLKICSSKKVWDPKKREGRRFQAEEEDVEMGVAGWRGGEVSKEGEPEAKLHQGKKKPGSKEACKLQATLVRVRNYHRPTDLLTGVKCRATSVAKEN